MPNYTSPVAHDKETINTLKELVGTRNLAKALIAYDSFVADNNLSGLTEAQKIGIFTDCMEDSDVQACYSTEIPKVQGSTERFNELLKNTPMTPRTPSPSPAPPQNYTYTDTLKQNTLNMFGPLPQHSLDRNHPMTREERETYDRRQKEAVEYVKSQGGPRASGWFSGMFSGGYRKTRHRKNRRTNRRKNKSRRA